MTPTPPYVELHCHSAYSFLDGVSLPHELAQRAGELGHTALALTDHNSVSGSMELAQVAPECGVRAIHGAEVDLAGGRHLTLLVREERGWRNLCRILTRAHAHTRDRTRRRERAEPSVDLQVVLEHAEGLVCLTGCARRSAAGGGAAGEAIARSLLDAFGPEDLCVELQRPYARDDRARNRALVALARRLGVACVATGDVHAHARGRAELQDAFVALCHRSTLDASEPLRRGNHSHVMSTPEAMANRFADHPEAVRETLALAERLTFDLGADLGYRYPGADDTGANGRLGELCHARLEDRYGRGELGARARSRLQEELQIVGKLGLAGFFLLHHDMLELAREVAREVRGPDSVRALLAPGRGRGSSVSSIVCHLTGLSHIDPIANELALGRFLHEDLRGLPDIDLDFPRDIREVLIPRVHERYGRDHAALVAAFPTFRTRGAIRELGKVLGLPPGELERIARSADRHGPGAEHDIAAGIHRLQDGDAGGEGPGGGCPPGEQALALGMQSPARAGAPSERVHGRGAGEAAIAAGVPRDRWDWLARLVQEAYGLPRHLSQHAGGMIVSTRPLIDCCPVVPAAMEGRQMVQWDKDSCADAGFLKIDLLGLGMLSAVERCVQEIARTRRERIDLSRIPFDDPATFAAIREADTVGVFQIESRAQMQSLRRTRPESLEDLTIQVAIVRPGPIQGGAINPYIERRRRLREDSSYEIPYEHPALEPVLSETLGTVIFQDQVMQVAEAFAGFSAGEADGLRRAMSRKRSHEEIQRHRERFVAGAMRHAGADRPTAERVWAMVEGFAGFGFPKAHGAAFGLLAYQSTWLRVHYGPEFLCALLNEQPMGFYAPDSLIHEAVHRGIPVLGLDVNASHVHCTVEPAEEEEEEEDLVGRGRGEGAGRGKGEGAGRGKGEGACAREGVRLGVRLGLGYVKDVASAEVRELVVERERHGRYRSPADLAARSGAGRATLQQLAWSGACDGLVEVAPGASVDTRRRVALWQLGMAAHGQGVGEGATQLALPLPGAAAPRLRPLGRWQRLIADYATSGVTAGDHALAILRDRLTVPLLATSAQLARLPAGCSVAVAGLVIARQRPGTARGAMFLLFEDEHGTINLIVPPPVYERYRRLARAEPLLLARGRLERAEGVINVIVRELAPLERLLAPAPGSEAESARVHRLSGGATVDPVAADSQAGEEGQGEEEEERAADIASDMRAVLPPMQSFAMGRRR